jgi:excisionase family DNA binding protein
MNEGEKLLTIKEFANKLNYSQRHIRQMCIDGKIKAQKLTHGSRKWLIPESEITSLRTKRERHRLVTQDGIYEYEKIMDIPPWIKNLPKNTK